MSLVSNNEMEGRRSQHRKRPRDMDDVDEATDEPRNHKQPKNRSQQNQIKPSSTQTQTHQTSHVPSLSPERSTVTKKKSKSERKNNPSSRIHSLKKQLAKAENMPMTIRRDKERELAALVSEQNKKMVLKAGKKNLQKYHFVRFIERQKAERTLKRLQQQLEKSDKQDEEAKAKIDQSIHETEVDINYTQYAPLAEKYISLYADEPHGSETKDQKRKASSKGASKPPMWYEVEKRMLEGGKRLKALREGRLSSEKKPEKDLSVSGKKKESRGNKKIAPVEGHSEDSGDQGIPKPDVVGSDDDENSSDGGFFER